MNDKDPCPVRTAKGPEVVRLTILERSCPDGKGNAWSEEIHGSQDRWCPAGRTWLLPGRGARVRKHGQPEESVGESGWTRVRPARYQDRHRRHHVPVRGIKRSNVTGCLEIRFFFT